MTRAARPLVLALLAAAGCDQAQPAPACQAPLVDDPAPACTRLDNVGAPVPVMAIASAVPQAVQIGGPIVDCAYELVQVDLYTGPGGHAGPTGATVQSTLSLAAGAYEQVIDRSDAGAARTAGTFVAAEGGSVAFTMAQACPDAKTLPGSYGSDGAATLRLVRSDGAGGFFGVAVHTFRTLP